MRGHLTLLPGDGIGPEVVAETLKILNEIGGCRFESLPWSADHYLRTGISVPPDGYDTLRSFD